MTTNLEKLVERWRASVISQEFRDKMEEYSRHVASGRTDLVLDLTDVMKNQYITREQTRQWCDNEDVDPTAFEQLFQVHRKPLSRLRSVVDYGCGSGIKGAIVYTLLRRLVGEASIGKIHLVDYSGEALAEAYQTCRDYGIGEEYIQVHTPVDFKDLGQILRKDPNPKLHLFLGQTIGNFVDPDIVIRNIDANARKDDCLFVEWFAKQPQDYERFENFYRLYLNDILGISSEAVGDYQPVQERDKNGVLWNTMPFTVQNVAVEKRTIKMQEKDYELKPGTRIIVSRSRRFKEREVLSSSSRRTGFWPLSWSTFEVYNLRLWMGHQSGKYALFRKIREPISRTEVSGFSFLAGLAAGLILSMYRC